jgi:transposase-like protein
MPQTYHVNATTNMHSRAIIQGSSLSTNELAELYHVSTNTVIKWKNRDEFEDKSSRPDTIHYALTPIEKEVIRAVRVSTWCALDDLTDTIQSIIPHAGRSNIYRTLMDFGINRVPEEKKEQAKKFKEYEPGYLHIDVTYLPKLEGVKYYLFVAIDRATRLLYFAVYDHKTAINAEDFLKRCKEYFPFYISHILTDNGAEFTDKFTCGKNEPSGSHKFDKVCTENNIDHRLTLPATPSTNGMVERVNDTIKGGTIKVNVYANADEMNADLALFLLFYNFARGHGGLRKELKVRTPFDALVCWYKLSPDLFKISPDEFKSIHVPNTTTL